MNLLSSLMPINLNNLAATMTYGGVACILLLAAYLFRDWCNKGVRNLIFISYRHDDVVTDIRKELASKFGKNAVFLDNKIKGGHRIRRRIKSALATCGVFVPAIGRAWLSATDRLRNDPDDYVHLEIVEALKRKIALIPVLIDNSKMPPSGELPADLKDLRDAKAIEIRRGKIEEDCIDLSGQIMELLPLSYKVKYWTKRIGFSATTVMVMILTALGAVSVIVLLFANGLNG